MNMNDKNDNNSNNNIANIELLLRKICFKVKQKGREILDDYCITPPQFDALQLLAAEGEMTVSELSNRLFLAPSTITDLIDRMEKNEHVTRTRDTKDRRIVKIKAMEKGKILIDEVIGRRCEYVDALLKDVDEADKGKLLGYLKILNGDNSAKC
jgi:MarR family transcriptional regulator, organic hydroperoxide resistance regulator